RLSSFFRRLLKRYHSCQLASHAIKFQGCGMHGSFVIVLKASRQSTVSIKARGRSHPVRFLDRIKSGKAKRVQIPLLQGHARAVPRTPGCEVRLKQPRYGFFWSVVMSKRLQVITRPTRSEPVGDTTLLGQTGELQDSHVRRDTIESARDVLSVFPPGRVCVR